MKNYKKETVILLDFLDFLVSKNQIDKSSILFKYDKTLTGFIENISESLNLDILIIYKNLEPTLNTYLTLKQAYEKNFHHKIKKQEVAMILADLFDIEEVKKTDSLYEYFENLLGIALKYK